MYEQKINPISPLFQSSLLDRRTVVFLYAPGLQRQVFKHVENLSERSKKMKEQKKNKGSVLVAEPAYNSQNAQFCS